MMASSGVGVSAGESSADLTNENFDTRQKFRCEHENNVAYNTCNEEDTPMTVPLDDVSLIESDFDLNTSSDDERESCIKEHVDLGDDPISISDENCTQNEDMTIAATTLTPTEDAIDLPAAGSTTDIEHGIPSSAATEGSEVLRTDNSYTVTWAAIARGEKLCGTTLPRFFWLMVLLGLLAVLCASVGYLLSSLQLQQ